MSVHSLRYFVVILMFHLPITALSQEVRIEFNKMSGESGEPLGKINAIGQDPSGYMWFAGQGEKCLYRYDGTRWRSYRHDILDSTALGVVDIETLHADNLGKIWIGGNGLTEFDPKTGIFKHYKSPGMASVNVILRDRKKRLWVGTNEGLQLLDEKTGKFMVYHHDPNDNRSLSDDVVRAVYEDSEGTIWVGTGWPFFNSDQKGGLNRLDADGKFTRFLHDPKDPGTLINNKVRAIFEDSRGIFWIGTSGDGLHTMDRKTGRFTRHQYDPRHPEKLSRPARKKDEWQLVNDNITFINEDRAGGIWIGTMCAGISRYDPQTEKVTRFESSNGFPDRSSWTAFQSRDGVMWLATQEDNLFRVDFIKKELTDQTLGTEVRRFLEDKNGFLWVTTENGLIQLDQNKKVIGRYLVDSAAAGNTNNSFLALFQNHPDTLWVGGPAGVLLFDTKTKKFIPFFDEGRINNLNPGRVIFIIQDHLGYIWITTMNGLFRYDPHNKSIKWYQHDETAGAISSNAIITIMEDHIGDVWVATAGGGLNRLDRKTDTFRKYLADSKETFLFEDSKGVRWVGTTNGIFIYDEKKDELFPFGGVSVLGKERIYGIQEDGSGNLWVITPSDITKINQDRTEFFSYGRKIGIEYLSPGTIYKTKNGEFLVGHSLGFYSFYPQQFLQSEQSFNLVVSDILINNKLLMGEDSKIVAAQNVTELNLAHDQNNIVLKYSALDFRAPEITKFLTKLEGYDDVWRPSAADRTANYFNVPPGHYTFHVKAFNAFGSKAIKTLAINITPPWWKTWWAYSTYGVLTLLLVMAGRREIVRRERLRATFELEHLQLQKAKEIDKAKSTFFTNISHEFRTPLTLIKGYSADLLEEYAHVPKTKDRLKMIGKNSDLLLKLINQLMDLARVESGTLVVVKSECHVNSFVTNLTNSFSSLAVQRKLNLSFSLPEVSCVALVDQSKLETILVNLISNAIKFTPSGGTVDVQASLDLNGSTEQSMPSENILCIRVVDTGIGIPGDKTLRVFERFYQINDSHKEVGTGVGLSLVQEFAELMKGTVTVTSELDKGSVFTVSVPVSVLRLVGQESPVIEVHESLEKVSQTNGEENGAAGKSKILVVEDNEDLIRFIVSSLGPDYHFLEATDGSQGLETARSEIPDVIITDIMMPRMDGMQLTKKLRADFRTSHIPILMLTAKASESDKLKGLALGADDYLTKPFNKKELVFKIQNSIAGRSRLREQLRIELMREAPTFQAESADEKFMLKVRTIILDRLADENLNVDFLASEIGLSRAQFYRKITALTGLPVNELIKSFRLQKAAKLLDQEWGPVSQVAYEVGFSNPSYFTKCFREEFGVLPSEYAQKRKSPII
jgi:signal transduction histidine kinase/ligand-binding sensor domain-containing protein/DNA-binding response OmpR family regulator